MPPVWTEEQREIVEAPPHARFLVEAGPGTGKTAVACGRVVFLLAQGIPPSAILMVSFTRTAVAEMKDRLARWGAPGAVSLVNVCTLDQAAFQFGIGCGAELAGLLGSFAGNIGKALAALKTGHPVLKEYLERFEHVIVDEAQDLTGARGQLSTLLLKALRRAAGVTIFADSCQAIYGFTTDEDGKTRDAQNFLSTCPLEDLGFETRALETIHRTDDESLLGFFRQLRAIVARKQHAGSAATAIVEAISQRGASQGEAKKLALGDGDLVLFRKRAAAINAAHWTAGTHRLRLPGYPPHVFPWIALTLSGWTEPTIGEHEFAERWSRLVPAELAAGFEAASAWALLRRIARGRRESVSLEILRELIARERPPVELCHLDCGATGPIFSTIHASKGREAARVFLMLPRTLKYLEDDDDAPNPEEEARVFYVGATRVREAFFHGVAETLAGAGRLDERRPRVVHLPWKASDTAKFQVGLAQDLDTRLLVSRMPCFGGSQAEAAERQQALIDLWVEHVRAGRKPQMHAGLACVKPHDKEQWLYQFLWDGQRIGWSGPELQKDLLKAAARTQQRCQAPPLKPNARLPHLTVVGLRTCALPTEASAAGDFHEPFSQSGFYLAPLVAGFAMFKFWNR